MSSLERYRPFFTEDEFARLLAELENPLPPTIRLNTLKTDIFQKVEPWPAWYGWQMEQIFFCASGYQLIQFDMPPGRTLEYKMGDYYIQDAASMLPVEMFTEMDSPLVLDMAAAPGGKTTHLVSKFQDKASIIANDSSASRLTAVRSNLQAWGAMGVMVTNFNGEQFGTWFPEAFDKILLDAPCSGDTLRPHKGSKQREVSVSEQERLQQRQIALLTAAFQAVKPGGEIVYSTCTMSPDENEAVLDALLIRYPQIAAVEAVSHLPFGENACGLISDGQHSYNPQMKNAIRLWPHLYRTSGFFAARIRKVDALALPAADIPYRDSKREPISENFRQKMVNSLLEIYGFDFLPTITAQHLTFWQQDDSIYAIPETLIDKFANLPYVASGFIAGQMMDGDFVPSHELITRFENQFTRQRIMVSDAQKKIWLEGRELRDLQLDLPYPVVLLQDEQHRFIGRGKISGARIRNLLPGRLIG